MDTFIDWVFAVGRVLIALLFVLSALKYHFGGIGMSYAESYRAPFPKLLVPFSGVVIVVAALALAVGAWADLAALVLVAFLLVTSYYMHPFWKERDPQAKHGPAGPLPQEPRRRGRPARDLLRLLPARGRDRTVTDGPAAR